MGERRIVKGWIVERQPDGTIVPIAPAGGQQMPADPTYPYKGVKAQADVQSTQVNTQGQAIDNRVKGATAEPMIAKAGADAITSQRTSQTAGLPEGLMWAPDGQSAIPIPGYTRQGLSPEVRQQAIQAYSDSEALDRAANEIEQLYKSGPGSTSGVGGVVDYLPTSGNKVFNDAGQQARGYIKRALGFTGGEGNTVAESSALYDPYLPTSWDRDPQIERKIQKMRELAADARKKATMTLGGVPNANGQVSPMQEDQRAVAGGQPPQIGDNPPDMPTGMADAIWKQQGPQGGQQIAGGSTRNVPNPGAQALAAELNAMFARGESPEAIASYARMRGGQFGSDVAGQVRDMRAYNKANPKNRDDQPFIGGMMQVDNPLISQAVASPTFGAAASAVDSLSAGQVLSRLAGDEMDALRAAHPNATMAGDVVGAIGGTSALGKLGAGVASRLAPRLLGGGRAAGLARGVGTDVAYGAAYGDATQDDALGGGLAAGLGSLGGRFVGSAAGKAIGGLRVDPAARALEAQGVPMTVGRMLGGPARSIEDAMTSAPLVGDLISNRQADAFEAFNNRAFNIGSNPIGTQIAGTGDEALGRFQQGINTAYDDATAGVNVPLDQQFMGDLGQVAASARQLPPDLNQRFVAAMDNRLQPVAQAGQMTGETYQQAQRGLKGYKAEMTKPGFEQDYRDALSTVQAALKSQMQRGGGQKTVEGLAKADDAYRNFKVLSDAVNRARNGTRSGEIGIFAPSQLNDAISAARKYGTPAELKRLGKLGQKVLPSTVPDSGTVKRLLVNSAGGLPLAGLGAYGVMTDPTKPEVAGPLALTAMLLAGGTKKGQKLLKAGIFSRPKGAKSVGKAIGKSGRALGAASIPLLIENQN